MLIFFQVRLYQLLDYKFWNAGVLNNHTDAQSSAAALFTNPPSKFLSP